MNTIPPHAAILSLACTLLPVDFGGAQSTLRVPSQHPDIQTALTAAVSGDTILVEPGLHLANDLDPLGKEVTIRGELGPQSTVLDGGLQGRLFVIQNGEGPALVIEDLTLRRARVPAGESGGAVRITGTASPTIRNCAIELCEGQNGTAIAVLDDASLTIEDAAVTRNETVGRGVVLLGRSAQLTMRRCELEDNRVGSPASDGGGLISTPVSSAGGTTAMGTLRLEACALRRNDGLDAVVSVRDVSVSLRDCVFEQHVGSSQRGVVRAELFRTGNSLEAVGCVFRDNVSCGQLFVNTIDTQNTVTVQRCQFLDNYCSSVRGALEIARGQLIVEDSIFARNVADGSLALIYYEAGNSTGRFRRCQVIDNWADSSGILWLFNSTDVRVESCLFARNTNAGPFSAILAEGTVDVEHCTIIDNACAATLPAGQVAVRATRPGGILRSCIVRGNTPLQLQPANLVAFNVSHCNVEGGFPGNTNFDADPQFLPGAGWRLSASSPCRDAGVAGAVSLDLDGTPRNAGGAPDVGCDEVPAQPFANTNDDFELHAVTGNAGDPFAPVLEPSVGEPIQLTLRSPGANLAGAPFLLLAELRPGGAPPPPPSPFPGLHLDIGSPGYRVALSTLANPSPLGPTGLPATNFTLQFTTPGGLTGFTVWLQAAAFSPATHNGSYALTRAVQLSLP